MIAITAPKALFTNFILIAFLLQVLRKWNGGIMELWDDARISPISILAVSHISIVPNLPLFQHSNLPVFQSSILLFSYGLGLIFVIFDP
jgi:hypothetical protein